MARWPAACTQPHTACGLTAPPTVPAQQRRRRGKRHKDGQGTAQGLELPAGPLMRLHPQGLIQGGHLRDVDSRGDTVRPVAATGAAQTGW